MSLYQSFENSSMRTNYNWYHRHLHVHWFFFSYLVRSRYLSLFSVSFNFNLLSFTPFQVFQDISRWFLTGGRVTASLFKSPGLFSVLWSILIMLLSGFSPFALLLLLLLSYSLWVYYTSFNWWIITRDKVTASLEDHLSCSVVSSYLQFTELVFRFLRTDLRAPNSIGISVKFVFHNCFGSMVGSKYLASFSPIFSFIFAL